MDKGEKMTDFNDEHEVTEAAKVSVMKSGALAKLKQIGFDQRADNKETLEPLKQQAENVIENIQQLLDSGKLDDSTSQKLSNVLNKLKGALAKGTISRVILAMVLSEATTVVSGVAEKGLTAQQKADKLWQRVESDNNDIDDDFEKMRKEGVAFNESLWNKHKELTEYLKAHPRDIAKQKELDAVDDAMLLQAEPQIIQHLNVKPAFDDAKDKSKDRHEVVDKDLAKNAEGKNLVSTNNDVDWNMDTAHHKQSSLGELSMNDVLPQSIGEKRKPSGKAL